MYKPAMRPCGVLMMGMPGCRSPWCRAIFVNWT